MLEEKTETAGSDPKHETRSRLAGAALFLGGLVALVFFCLALGAHA